MDCNQVSLSTSPTLNSPGTTLGGGGGVSFYILTEGGDRIITESGDPIVTEDAP